MGFAGAETEIRIAIDDVVEGVVIPPQHPDHRFRVLLIDGHGQIAQEADVEGGLHHQRKAGTVGDRIAIERGDAVGELEPDLQLLLQGQGRGWSAATPAAPAQTGDRQTTPATWPETCSPPTG